MRYLFCSVLVMVGVTGCAPSQQSLQNQSIAKMDSELMVLDLQNQDPASARMHLNEAQTLAPRNPYVLIAAGYFDLQMGDLADASQEYQTAIAKAPDDPNIENDYGTFLYQQAEYAQALSYFLKAAQNPANSVSAEAFENAGLAEIKLNQPSLAEKDFQHAEKEGLNGAF